METKTKILMGQPIELECARLNDYCSLRTDLILDNWGRIKSIVEGQFNNRSVYGCHNRRIYEGKILLDNDGEVLYLVDPRTGRDYMVRFDIKSLYNGTSTKMIRFFADFNDGSVYDEDFLVGADIPYQ